MLRRGFRRRRTGYELRLPDDERAVLDDVLGQLESYLSPPEPGPVQDPLAQLVGIPEEVERPTDPAMLRLFPDAYDNPDEAGDFRRFTESDLRRQRAERAGRARGTLSRVAGDGRVPLDAQEAQDWLTALNDIRIVLGTRLGVTEDESELPAVDGAPALYDWLTWLQATLVEALLP